LPYHTSSSLGALGSEIGRENEIFALHRLQIIRFEKIPNLLLDHGT
jgi:hypothetical protein